MPELLVVALSWHIVTQANGAEWDEAEVERLQEVPVLLHHREDYSRDEEEAGDHDDG